MEPGVNQPGLDDKSQKTLRSLRVEFSAIRALVLGVQDKRTNRKGHFNQGIASIDTRCRLTG